MPEEAPNLNLDNQGVDTPGEQVQYAKTVGDDSTIGDVTDRGGSAAFTMPGHEDDAEAVESVPETNDTGQSEPTPAEGGDLFIDHSVTEGQANSDSGEAVPFSAPVAGSAERGHFTDEEAERAQAELDSRQTTNSEQPENEVSQPSADDANESITQETSQSSESATETTAAPMTREEMDDDPDNLPVMGTAHHGPNTDQKPAETTSQPEIDPDKAYADLEDVQVGPDLSGMPGDLDGLDQVEREGFGQYQREVQQEPTETPGSETPTAPEAERTVSDPDKPEEPEDIVAAETSSTTRGLASYEGALLASEVTSRKGLKGFWDRIKHNFTREGRRMSKEMEVRESGKVGLTPEEEESVRAIAVERAKLAENGTRELKDEHHIEIAKYPGGQDLIKGIEQLVLDSDPMSREELQAEVDRLMDEFGAGLHDQDRDRGLSFATNIVDSAMQYKACLSYARGMDNLDEIERLEAKLRGNLEGLRLAEVDIGARTERQTDRVDRVVDRLVKNKVLRAMFSETAVAVAVGTAYTAGALLLERGGSTALRFGGVALAPVTLGASVVAAQALAAGTVGAIRESRAMYDDQLLVARANARGETLDGGNSRRREQIKDTLYETQSMQESTSLLDTAREDIESGDPARVQAGFRVIAETKARIAVSEEQRVDLFDASSAESFAREQLDLELALAQAEHSLLGASAGMSDQELHDIGLERDVKAQLEAIISNAESIIPEVVLDQVEKDKAFKKLRITRALKAAGIGAVIGAGIGVGLQELRAAIAPDLIGLADKSESGSVRTLMAALVDKEALTGKSGEKAAGLLSHTAIGKNSQIAAPPGMKIIEAGQGGGFKLVDGSGNTVVDHVSVDYKGHLTPQSVAEFGKHDLKIAEKVQNYTAMEPRSHTSSRSVDQFIGHHRGKFTKVSREMWYDNNTSGKFDKNELRLTWGNGGKGITENGNYVFSVGGMTQGGSYHGGAAANAPGLVGEGKMMMAISVDRAHQHTPLLVPIDRNGNAIIKADSALGRALFSDHNGQAVFRGAYAEAVQITGHRGGATIMRPLATEVGSNSVHRIKDTITTLTPTQHSRVITEIIPIHKETPTEVPFIYPIYARRGVGDIKRENDEPTEQPIEPAPTAGVPVSSIPTQPPQSDDEDDDDSIPSPTPGEEPVAAPNPPQTPPPTEEPEPVTEPSPEPGQEPVSPNPPGEEPVAAPNPPQTPPPSTPPTDEETEEAKTAKPRYSIEVGGSRIPVSEDAYLYAMGIDPRIRQGENGEDSVITTPQPGMRYEWQNFTTPDGRSSRVLQEIDADGNVVRPNVVLESGDGYSYETYEVGNGKRTKLVDSEGNKIMDMPSDWVGWEHGQPPLTQLEKNRLKEAREAQERGEEVSIIDPENKVQKLSRGELLRDATLAYPTFKEPKERQTQPEKTADEKALDALTPEQLINLLRSSSQEQIDALGLSPEQARMIDELKEVDNNDQES